MPYDREMQSEACGLVARPARLCECEYMLCVFVFAICCVCLCLQNVGYVCVYNMLHTCLHLFYDYISICALWLRNAETLHAAGGKTDPYTIHV